MKVNLRHVQRRGDGFFFRMAIPSELQKFYRGRKEISQSLRTQNPFELQQMAFQLAAFYRQQFHQLKVGSIQHGEQACVDSLINSELMHQGRLTMSEALAGLSTVYGIER